MNDGSREIDAELKAEAMEAQAAWTLECSCGLRFAEFQDLDAHQRLDCDDWLAWMDGLYDDEETGDDAHADEDTPADEAEAA